MTEPSAVESVDLVWTRQRIWSRTAGNLKDRVDHKRLFSLVTLLVCAVLGTLATQLESREPALATTLAVVAAVGVALGAFVRSRVSVGAVQDWTAARAASEALKAQVHVFLAGAAPYRDRSVRRLVDDAAATCRRADKVRRHTVGVKDDGRKLPNVSDVDSYFAVRVAGQIHGYYRPAAEAHALRLKRLRRAELVLGAVGAVLFALASVVSTGSVTAWIGVITTVVAALAAHSAQAEYEYLMTEYDRTANRLQDLLSSRVAGSDEADDALVAACERVIFDQNEAWLTRIGGAPDPAGST